MEAKRYRVIITELGEKTSIQRSYERLADTGNEQDDGPVYGWVEFPEQKEVSRAVLDMQVDEIDLDAIVAAILGWPKKDV